MTCRPAYVPHTLQTVCGRMGDLQRAQVAAGGSGVRSHWALRCRVLDRDFLRFGTATTGSLSSCHLAVVRGCWLVPARREHRLRVAAGPEASAAVGGGVRVAVEAVGCRIQAQGAERLPATDGDLLHAGAAGDVAIDTAGGAQPGAVWMAQRLHGNGRGESVAQQGVEVERALGDLVALLDIAGI